MFKQPLPHVPLYSHDIRMNMFLTHVTHPFLQVVPNATGRINHVSDTVLSNGFVIPRHTTVMTTLVQLHMNPKLFPEPER
jgi:cytochrome P450